MIAQFHKIWESIADAIPEDDAVVQGDRRVSWAQYEDRASRLAQSFLDAGLGRDSKVGMFMYNSPEYCETNFAALKIGGVPINVNYRYLEDELAYLLDNADIEAMVFNTSLGERVAHIADKLPNIKKWIHVHDDPAVDLPSESVSYDDVLAAHEPAARRESDGDEIYMFYTGGTTGMPKGVMYSLTDFTTFFMSSYPAQLGLEPIEDPATIAAIVARLSSSGGLPPAMTCAPLMHGTGCWLGLMVPHMFGTPAVLLESRSLDPAEVWSTIERESVGSTVIVGDAFARPLLRALDDQPGRWDVSSLGIIVSSGAMFSTEVKQGLLEHIPNMMIADALGSTEGSMGAAMTTKDSPATETAKFVLTPTSKVFTEDDREVVPGSGEMGMVAAGGLMTPLGYYKDPEKSARTFREIDGQRWSFIGDWATVEADGSITLLGRGSVCINTGGEKVFPEEVEEVLKLHGSVVDAIAVGVPDDRFGQAVQAVVEVADEAAFDEAGVIDHVKASLARYKAPKRVFPVASLERAANGKIDYKRWTAFAQDQAG